MKLPALGGGLNRNRLACRTPAPVIEPQQGEPSPPDPSDDQRRVRSYCGNCAPLCENLYPDDPDRYDQCLEGCLERCR